MPAWRARAATRLSQTEEAAARLTGPSPGTRAASASAARSSQLTGKVTTRAGWSGSGLAATRRILVPCHRRIAFMGAE